MQRGRITNADCGGVCSVGTVLFTALGISVATICAHGAFRVPDDLFTDEAEVRLVPILCGITRLILGTIWNELGSYDVLEVKSLPMGPS
jgi:hypothetical protein